MKKGILALEQLDPFEPLSDKYLVIDLKVVEYGQWAHLLVMLNHEVSYEEVNGFARVLPVQNIEPDYLSSKNDGKPIVISNAFYKTFQIHCGTYDFAINFVISNDLVKACKFINFKLELSNKKDVEINPTDLDCLGKRFFVFGYCPIIWLPEFPKSPEQIGTAIHEIFHAVCDCMRWANIQLTNSSEEAYCHLLKYVTKKFFNESQR